LAPIAFTRASRGNSDRANQPQDASGQAGISSASASGLAAAAAAAARPDPRGRYSSSVLVLSA